jgi:hypothetical protein
MNAQISNRIKINSLEEKWSYAFKRKDGKNLFLKVEGHAKPME